MPLQKDRIPFNKALKKNRNPLHEALKMDRIPFNKALKKDRNPLKKA